MIIRPIEEFDQKLLWDMLFEMIYFPEGETKPDKEKLLRQPNIAKYVAGFGWQECDTGFVAESDLREVVGAAWFRLFSSNNQGYGYIDDNTPELGIAVIENHRGVGIGTRLLKTLIDKAKADGYPSISLSVDYRNIALRLYKREGFVKVRSSHFSWTMKLEL